MILNSFEKIIKTYFDTKLVQGVVVDNNDPLMKSRLRVSIDGMTNNIDKDDLPWYPQILPAGNTKAKVPPPGTRVVLHYIDIYNSLVLGSVVSITPK
jgi:hypothetical protein